MITIVAPVYNERELIAEFVARACGACEKTGEPFELLIVDDGSSRPTQDALRQLAASEPRMSVLRLSRNYGKEAAVTAGLDHARGDAVIVMDADLQDEPELIPTLVRYWFVEGYDAVYVVFERRQGTLLRRLLFSLYYRVYNALSGDPIPLQAGDFCLMSRRVVEAIGRMGDGERFLREMRHRAGFRQIGVPVTRPTRPAGETKFTWSKLMKLASAGLFGYPLAPIRALPVLGLALVVFGVTGLIAARPSMLSELTFGAAASLMGIVCGILVMAIAIVGEYAGRTYRQSLRRPLYEIQERFGGQGTTEAAEALTSAHVSKLRRV